MTTPSATIRTGCCRIKASCASRPRVGFSPTSPLTDGRDPDRAAAVVRVRDRHRARGDQRRRTGAGRARAVLEVPRVRTGPKPRVLAAGTEAVLRQLGLAERDQPGREVHPREVAVLLRGVRRPRVGALHRRHAGDVDVVLDEGRHAGEVAAAGSRGPRVWPGRSPRRRPRRARRRPARCGRWRRRRPRGSRPCRPRGARPARPHRGRPGHRRRRRARASWVRTVAPSRARRLRPQSGSGPGSWRRCNPRRAGRRARVPA